MEEGDRPPSSFSSSPQSAIRNPQSPELVCRFLAYLEANAEDYWKVPTLELAPPAHAEQDEDLYGAAYEGVTYRDTTDSTEGEVVGGEGPVGEFPLEQEAERIETRLRFLSTLARLWLVAARFLRGLDRGEGKRDLDTPDVASALTDCKREALGKYEALTRLLDAIHEQELPASDGDESSLVDYDRRRGIKDHLLMTAVGTTLDMAMAIRWLTLPGRSEEHAELQHAPRDVVHSHAGELDQAMLEGDRTRVLELLPRFTRAFRNQPLLHVRLEEGGSPRQIVRVRLAQTTLRNLLVNLPRLGLVRETYQLLRTAREMEQAQPLPGRGITEFNHFFQAALQSVVEWVVESASGWFGPAEFDQRVVDLLEEMIQPFAELWLEHSQSLQLSVLEPAMKERSWSSLTRFIQSYGVDLFHPRFLALGNLRGILHQGVDVYLNHLEANDDPLKPNKLVEDLGKLDRGQVAQMLRVILQAVVENYEEYKDYNATTTQSDYGGNLHLLLESLRLKVAYERTAWQLRPLMLVHEVLARQGTSTAARKWEESLATHTRQPAHAYLDQLAALERQSSIRLMTVRHRLEERFVKPLSLDRLCALVEPCMAASFDRDTQACESGNPQSREESFARFQEEMATFTSSPTGVGLDVPGWLRRLEMEVRRVQAMRTSLGVLAETFFKVPRVGLSYEEMRAQVFPEPLPPPREV
jgi:hypothetical protein